MRGRGRDIRHFCAGQVSKGVWSPGPSAPIAQTVRAADNVLLINDGPDAPARCDALAALIKGLFGNEFSGEIRALSLTA